MASVGATGIVYVVDTDDAVREGLSRVFVSAGLRSRCFSSLGAVLRQPPAANATCALLDVDGLHQVDPSHWPDLCALAQAIPVIALSARDDPQTRRLARALGAQAFFRKPVDAAALLDSIDWVIGAEARQTPN